MLAAVTLSVEWERRGRVCWQDGPTPGGADEPGGGVGQVPGGGAPLPFADLRFARSDSVVVVALAWLARGSPESPAAARAAIAEVEAFCADTGSRRLGSMRAAWWLPSCCGG
jgi:hypothetical protein